MPGSAAEVRDSKTLDVGMRVGLVAYGAMHLLIGYLVDLKLGAKAAETAKVGDSAEFQRKLAALRDAD